jgi:hypothetical protein
VSLDRADNVIEGGAAFGQPLFLLSVPTFLSLAIPRETEYPIRIVSRPAPALLAAGRQARDDGGEGNVEKGAQPAIMGRTSRDGRKLAVPQGPSA